MNIKAEGRDEKGLHLPVLGSFQKGSREKSEKLVRREREKTFKHGSETKRIWRSNARKTLKGSWKREERDVRIALSCPLQNYFRDQGAYSGTCEKKKA